MEWHTGGANIEIYIESPASVSFFAERVGSGDSVEESLPGHESELKQWLESISVHS